ncbi:hypothetical protein AK830_g10296 [Neonectria ditissima]|uniref:EGF-like domain-containing protein n=1 Tax=Neonectria ditissima TaxID=78410 RepID=A0A0P7ATK0_9HYPO|nr:hypothetical protein AK830_g10296 [Neonectria ditissima]
MLAAPLRTAVLAFLSFHAANAGRCNPDSVPTTLSSITTNSISSAEDATTSTTVASTTTTTEATTTTTLSVPTPCTADMDCSQNESCVDGFCTTESENNGGADTCSTNDDCTSNIYCLDGLLNVCTCMNGHCTVEAG